MTDVGFSAEPALGTYYSAMHSGHSGAFQASDPMVQFRFVDPNYFPMLRSRLLKGRHFTGRDLDRPATFVILNESAARLLFGTSDVVGRTVHSGLGDRQLEVVGVVQDIRTSGLDRPAPPMRYFPYMPHFGASVVYAVRARGDLSALETTVRRRVL